MATRAAFIMVAILITKLKPNLQRKHIIKNSDRIAFTLNYRYFVYFKKIYPLSFARFQKES